MKPTRETLRQLIAENRNEVILILGVLIYTVVFSHATALKHYGFSSYAWDLGVFNQLLHYTAFEGKPFYYTPDLYFNNSGSYLVIHFSPILALLLPIYYLFPGVITLLRIKALLLASGAIPLYLLSNEHLHDKRLSLYIAFAYLLYPGLQGANWFDFQQQVFLPLLLFTALYLFTREKWVPYVIALALTLMVFELSFVIVIASLACLLIYEKPLDLISQLREFKPNKTHAAILTTLFGVIYYLGARWVMSGYTINPLFRQQYLASNVFNVVQYGGNTILLPLYVFTHLGDVAQALSFDAVLKLLYLIFLFGPLLFLPLTARPIIPILLLLSPFLLSNYRAYYMIGSHYPLYLIAPIFLALILVYSRHLGSERRRLAGRMLAVAAIFAVALSPLSPVSDTLNRDTATLWYPPPSQNTRRVEGLHTLIDMVPKSASILSQNHVFPHFSDRVNAYVLPTLPPGGEQEEYLKAYIDQLVEKSDYILLDLRTYDASTSYVFETTLTEDTDLHLARCLESAILITRKQVEAITIADTYPRTYTIKEGLYVGKGIRVADETSENGTAARSTPGSREGHLVYGPYEFMERGTYRVTFRIRTPTPSDGYIGTFDAYDSGETLTERDIYGYELEDDGWTIFTATLHLERARAAVEFRFRASDRATALFDSVHVEILQAPKIHASTMSIDPHDLNVVSGRITPDRLLEATADTATIPVAWSGPYLSLPAGDYTITYQLKPTKLQLTSNATIFHADITTRSGRHTIAEKWATLDAMQPITPMWYMLTFNITLTQETELELRGTQLQGGWSLDLSQILVEPTP